VAVSSGSTRTLGVTPLFIVGALFSSAVMIGIIVLAILQLGGAAILSFVNVVLGCWDVVCLDERFGFGNEERLELDMDINIKMDMDNNNKKKKKNLNLNLNENNQTIKRKSLSFLFFFFFCFSTTQIASLRRSVVAAAHKAKCNESNCEIGSQDE
jgi:MFS-type transporter involved in bile tolerance (Atg22 family)